MHDRTVTQPVRAGGPGRARRSRSGCGRLKRIDSDQILPTRSSDGVRVFAPSFHLAGQTWPGCFGDVLGSLQLAQRFLHVAGDAVVVDFGGLDDAFRVDHEGAAQRHAFFVDVHAEHVGQRVGRVADQRELGLADRRRGLVPDLVREMRVGGDDVDLGVELLEFGVVVGRVLDFGRAVEGEGGRHEDQHRPLALQGLLGDFDELAVVERLDLERLDCGVDQRHTEKLLDSKGKIAESIRDLGLVRS